MSPNVEASFWQRMGLEEAHRDVCIRAVQEIYLGVTVEEFDNQGYCSFTLLISQPSTSLDMTEGPIRSNSIVQIRPHQHSLDISIAHDARTIYGSLAPSLRLLNCELPGALRAYEMDLLNGIPFSQLQPRSVAIDHATWMKQVKLIESFASFVARGWPSSATKASEDRRARADTPVEDGWLDQCRGKVGARIVSKLERLACQLPSKTLRERAKDTVDRLLALKEFPVVLNHGDLIPTNILVDGQTWEIIGLVDWAEAEWLPFGTCLYGLEHLLGFLSFSDADARPVFTYYECADELRSIFWERLCKENPVIGQRVEDVRLMQDIGVLLWLGYAWDEGRIDRVVNEIDDAQEMTCLRAFLGIASE